jgi:hypothetical protein
MCRFVALTLRTVLIERKREGRERRRGVPA